MRGIHELDGGDHPGLPEHDYCWRYITKVPGLHKWFRVRRLDGTSGIAVADDSGRYPDETDDGVLWLDTSEPILAVDDRCPEDLAAETEPWWIRCNIRLLDNEGNRTWLGGTNLKEGRELNRLFGIPIATARIRYKH